MEKSVLYILSLCGHLCICKACADKVDKCPICRKKKTMMMKMY